MKYAVIAFVTVLMVFSVGGCLGGNEAAGANASGAGAKGADYNDAGKNAGTGGGGGSTPAVPAIAVVILHTAYFLDSNGNKLKLPPSELTANEVMYDLDKNGIKERLDFSGLAAISIYSRFVNISACWNNGPQTNYTSTYIYMATETGRPQQPITDEESYCFSTTSKILNFTHVFSTATGDVDSDGKKEVLFAVGRQYAAYLLILRPPAVIDHETRCSLLKEMEFAESTTAGFAVFAKA